MKEIRLQVSENNSSEYKNDNVERSDSEWDSVLMSSPVKKTKKVRWSREEKEIIYKKFSRAFLLKQNPKRSEIKAVWEFDPLLKNNRTLQQVCTFVNNIVTNKCKILTPDKNRIKELYY